MEKTTFFIKPEDQVSLPSSLPEDATFGEWVKKVVQDFLEGEVFVSRPIDPLVVDMDGDGIELVSLAESTAFFDLDDDGIAEKTGWVGKDDGLLALDKNGNGEIDGINEVFGNDETAGLVELATHDDNEDGVIDKEDDVYDELVIWRDADQDGVTDAGETVSLKEANIISFSLQDNPTNEEVEGNLIAGFSEYTKTDGTKGQVAEVHFALNQTDSITLGDGGIGRQVTVDLKTLFLPQHRGYGDLPALHIAMTENETLYSLVDSFKKLSASEFLDGLREVENILLTWAEVEGIDPDSRGNNMDARHLAFLEKFFGEKYEQNGGSNPDVRGASFLKLSWGRVYEEMSRTLLIEGPWSEIFPNAKYSYGEDQLTLGSSLDDILDKAQNLEPAEESLQAAFWMSMYKTLDSHREELGVESEKVGTSINEKWDVSIDFDVDTNIIIKGDEADDISGGSGSDIVYAGGGEDKVVAGSGNDLISGEAGNDVLSGGSGSDSLYGGEGDDELYGSQKNVYSLFNDLLEGGAGNDSLYGEGGLNTLIGGSGDDLLKGSWDVDVYQFEAGFGNDRINDFGNKDVKDILKFGEGFKAEDMIRKIEGEDLKISFVDREESLVLQKFYTESTVITANYNIEEAHFSGGTIVDLASPFTSYWTDKDDEIEGLESAERTDGGGGSDTIDGKGGDDQLWGNTGNDVLSGGSGSDSLYGGEGDDELYGSQKNVYSLFNDLLEGGAGNDSLYGEGGLNTLIGGSGDDLLKGSWDVDVYQFEEGFGNDKIYDLGYKDVKDILKFGEGFKAEDMIRKVEGEDLK